MRAAERGGAEAVTGVQDERPSRRRRRPAARVPCRRSCRGSSPRSRGRHAARPRQARDGGAGRRRRSRAGRRTGAAPPRAPPPGALPSLRGAVRAERADRGPQRVHRVGAQRLSGQRGGKVRIEGALGRARPGSGRAAGRGWAVRRATGGRRPPRSCAAGTVPGRDSRGRSAGWSAGSPWAWRPGRRARGPSLADLDLRDGHRVPPYIARPTRFRD